MLFVKNGIEIGVDNPVCYNLFVRQGWTPVESHATSVETEENMHMDGNDAVKVDTEATESGNDGIKIYKKGHFNTMSVDKIKELAEELGYTITATKKADIIEEFLLQQNLRV